VIKAPENLYFEPTKYSEDLEDLDDPGQPYLIGSDESLSTRTTIK
jgi:hypothetical protein